MRYKFILIVFFLFITISLKSQSSDINKTKLDSLNKIKERYLEQIQVIEKEIKDLQQNELVDTLKYSNRSANVKPLRVNDLENEVDKKNIEKLLKIGSPIYFISAKVTFNSIGNPEAVVTLKNISKKEIDAYTLILL